MDNYLLNLFTQNQNPPSVLLTVVFILLLLLSISLKGVALFHAARREEKPWFVALLFLNTFGVLEVAYLFFFSKDKLEIQKVRVDIEKLIARKK